MRPSGSRVIRKALASLKASAFVDVAANPATNPANPDRLRGGPCAPFLNPYVVLHVGQAMQGALAHTSLSVNKSPLHKSNAHLGQFPWIAYRLLSTLAHATRTPAPNSQPLIVSAKFSFVFASYQLVSVINPRLWHNK